VTITREDVVKVLADVRANRAKLEACPHHRFQETATFGKDWICEQCGGRMQVDQVLAYCDGFAAAGGDARAVWAPWQARRGGLNIT
jgi:hypothetical protein